MKQLSPQIELKKQLSEQISSALEWSVVQFILNSSDSSSEEDTWLQSRMTGHCMRVSEKLLPDLYHICQNVKCTLGYDSPVDFYVTGSSELNAFSISTMSDDKSNIVNINSSILELMSESELKFVIGHELGHLINKDTDLHRLVKFVYPPEHAKIPIALQYKLRLHDQLAELVADRYGYLACKNVDACISAFYKLASGLDLPRMNVKIEDLIEENRKNLEFFTKGEGISSNDHPVNPIRIEAIDIYAKAKTKKQLDTRMQGLIEILLKLGNNPLQAPMSTFFATAGLIVANADNDFSKEEFDQILISLSASNIFSKDILRQIMEAPDDVPTLFQKSINQILEINPGMKDGLLLYMMDISMADNNIHENEFSWIYKLGESIGVEAKQISRLFGEMIRQKFQPSIGSIC